MINSKALTSAEYALKLGTVSFVIVSGFSVFTDEMDNINGSLLNSIDQIASNIGADGLIPATQSSGIALPPDPTPSPSLYTEYGGINQDSLYRIDWVSTVYSSFNRNTNGQAFYDTLALKKDEFDCVNPTTGMCSVTMRNIPTQTTILADPTRYPSGKAEVVLNAANTPHAFLFPQQGDDPSSIHFEVINANGTTFVGNVIGTLTQAMVNYSIDANGSTIYTNTSAVGAYLTLNDGTFRLGDSHINGTNNHGIFYVAPAADAIVVFDADGGTQEEFYIDTINAEGAWIYSCSGRSMTATNEYDQTFTAFYEDADVSDPADVPLYFGTDPSCDIANNPVFIK